MNEATKMDSTIQHQLEGKGYTCNFLAFDGPTNSNLPHLHTAYGSTMKCEGVNFWHKYDEFKTSKLLPYPLGLCCC